MYDNGIVNQAMQMQLATKPSLFGSYVTILHAYKKYTEPYHSVLNSTE